VSDVKIESNVAWSIRQTGGSESRVVLDDVSGTAKNRLIDHSAFEREGSAGLVAGAFKERCCPFDLGFGGRETRAAVDCPRILPRPVRASQLPHLCWQTLLGERTSASFASDGLTGCNC